MARVSLTRGYKGKAHVSLRPRNGLGRKFRLGNTTALSESIEVDRQAREDFQEVGGGELDVVENVTSLTAEMTVNDIKPETLAVALRAALQKLASAAITDESQDAWGSERVTFAYIPDPDQTITVKIAASVTWAATTPFALGNVVVDGDHAYQVRTAGTSAAAEPTWPTDGGTVADGTVTWKDLGVIELTKDTHYAHTAHGVKFIAGGDALFTGDYPLPLAVTYTRNAQYSIQALVDAGTEFEVTVDGLNEVDSGNPVIVRYFRCKFSPTSGFARIGSEFAELPLTMTVLKDESRTGTGLSQYMEILMI